MSHLDNRLRIADCANNVLESLDELLTPPRPYQVQTIRNLRDWLSDTGGSRRANVIYPTGMGKTYLFGALSRFAYEVRTLIIVPTKVLIEQTIRQLSGFYGGMFGHLSSLNTITDDDGNVLAMRDYSNTNICVTTDASLRTHSGRVLREFNPQIIIRDECHWSYSPPSASLLNEFPDAVIVGFTATPDFLTMVPPMIAAEERILPNGRKVYVSAHRTAERHFGHRLDDLEIAWGIKERYLSPFAWSRLSFDINLATVPVTGGVGGFDFNESVLGTRIGNGWTEVCAAVSRLYQNNTHGIADRQVFSVCPSIRCAAELTQTVNALGIPSVYVTSDQTDKECDAALRSFAGGRHKHIASVAKLREGWDAPNADICLMLRPTLSILFYLQTLGRVLRCDPNNPGKRALVIDGSYQNLRHEPVSAPFLFCPPTQKINDGDYILQ